MGTSMSTIARRRIDRTIERLDGKTTVFAAVEVDGVMAICILFEGDLTGQGHDSVGGSGNVNGNSNDEQRCRGAVRLSSLFFFGRFRLLLRG